MILDRDWRERQLARQLEVWGPRVGTEVATTFNAGRVRNQIGVVALVTWIVVTLAIGIAIHGAGPVEGVVAALLWPLILFCFGSSIHFFNKARRGAAAQLATRPDADVPLRNVEQFDHWQAHGKYSRANPNRDQSKFRS